MLTRDQLRTGAERAYERGRFCAAARVGWYLVPIATLCALQTGACLGCAGSGALLLGMALYLRWRDRRGMSAVSAGLAAGAVPLVVGLLLRRLAPACADAPLVSLCTAVCLAVGVPSGLWLGVRAARARLGTADALTATGVATLASSLGCVGLGVAGVVGAALGLALGGALTLVPARQA